MKELLPLLDGSEFWRVIFWNSLNLFETVNYSVYYLVYLFVGYDQWRSLIFVVSLAAGVFFF